jgi:hypothetical protein
MRKQMIENAAFEVATQIRAVEDGIDTLIAEAAAAISGLVQTRGAIVACHSALVDAKGKVPGLRETAWGDGDDCPEDTKGQLRIVA